MPSEPDPSSDPRPLGDAIPAAQPSPDGRVATLIALFDHRWTVPVLAELGRRGGAKFITLANATGASPGSVRLSLDDLIARGWVLPNPGYGHPLRPEYLLTPAGERLAPICARLDDTLSAMRLREHPLRKWSVPVLDAIALGAERFNSIARRLGGITDRALSLSLVDLRRVPLVERRLVNEPGAVVRYGITPAGGRVIDAILGLSGHNKQ